MPSFNASQVDVLEEDDTLIVGLRADATDLRATYLIFQQSLSEYTEQDSKLGTNQPYIEYCDQGWGWNGEMTLVELRRDRLVVTMSPVAAAQLGGDGVFDVTFTLDDPAFAQLRTGLEKTFAGRATFVVRLSAE